MKRNSFRNLSVFTVLLLLIAGVSVVAAGPSLNSAQYMPAVLTSPNCTTIVSAGQSIRAAVDAAQSGAVICVRGGVYNEQVQIQPSKTGITLTAYANEKPIIDGQGNNPPSTSHLGLVHIRASNVTVEGFEVRNSGMRGVTVVQSPNDSQPLQNVTVRNMVVHGSWDSGINVNGNGSVRPRNILIENNTVYNNLRRNANGATGGSGLTFIEVENSIARGNRVYNNIGEGLVAGRFTANLTFEDNVSYDNQHSNIYVVNTANPTLRRNFVFCTDDKTFWSRATPRKPSAGIQLRDESFDKLSVKPPPSSGQIIVNNIVVGCGTNFGVSSQVTGGGLTNALVANNTFVNARGDADSINNVLIEGDVVLKNTRFVNNLILQTTPGAMVRILVALGNPDMSSFTLANNLYNQTPANAWPANEPGRIVADPKLIDPAVPIMSNLPSPEDYGIQSNSPAINSGTAVSQVTDDFFKQARSGTHDIGADEANGGSTQTTRIIVRKQTVPAGDPQAFQFASNFAGSFQLSHGGEKATDLSPGTYNVSETIPAGWSQMSATCSDGSQPTAINLAQGESVTCTFINQKDAQGSGSLEGTVYLTTQLGGTVGGVTFSPGDILSYHGPSGVWSMFFDGSDVGITKAINDFALMSDGSILLALNGKVTLRVPGGTYKSLMQDIVRFRPTSTGTETGGTWEQYFDGSDVGLTLSSEKIDALAVRSDGTLLISTAGKASVKNGATTLTAQDEDVLAFVPSGSSNGVNTSGTWSLALDGSQFSGMAAEDITAVWLDNATGEYYVALMDDFVIDGVGGTNKSILTVKSPSIVSIFWNAGLVDFPGPIDGLHIIP